MSQIRDIDSCPVLIARSNSDNVLIIKSNAKKSEFERSLSFEKNKILNESLSLLNNNTFDNNIKEITEFESEKQEIDINRLQKKICNLKKELHHLNNKNKVLEIENNKKYNTNQKTSLQLKEAIDLIIYQKESINKLKEKEEFLKTDLQRKSEEIVLLNERLQCIEIEPLLEKINDFHCPISLEIFKNPILADDGHTYEEMHFRNWIRHKRNNNLPIISPKTGNYISGDYKKNHLIKNLINSYQERHSYLLNQDLRICELHHQLDNKRKLKQDLEQNIINCQIEIDKKRDILSRINKPCINSCRII